MEFIKKKLHPAKEKNLTRIRDRNDIYCLICTWIEDHQYYIHAEFVLSEANLNPDFDW